jgi:hypothetical protein
MDAYDGSAAGLAFEGDKTKCFLHSWVNEKIRCPIDLCEFELIGTIPHPGYCSCCLLQLDHIVPVKSVSDDECVETSGKLFIELRKSLKENFHIFFRREPPNVQ